MLTPQEVFDTMTGEGDVALYKLDEWADKTPDKTFIHYGETGLRLSFAQVKQRADRLAAGLAEIGVARGARISVLTGNSLAAALSMFAAWRIGALFAPINYNLRGGLLSYQINDTGPRVLITDTSFDERLGEIAGNIDIDHIVVLPEHYGAEAPGEETLAARFENTEMHRFSDLLQSDAPVSAEDLGPFDRATIIYTSGTTGPAKGVLLGFRWINQYTFSGRSQLEHDDVLYCDLPMYHVGGAYALLCRGIWHGNTVGLWNRFSASGFWERIASCGATSCILLDVMVPWLMAAPPDPADKENTLNKVHMQPLPANHHEVAQRFGFDFITCGFGQTESGAGFMAIIDQFVDDEGTPAAQYHGMPKPAYRAQAERFGRVVVDGAILDEDDRQLPPGAVGQLAFRPRFPGLLLERYLNKPEATLKATRNLWFHTGDACAQDDDGTYRFVDRMGGYFRVRGENVSSYEVESVINAHPKVRATAAVPVPASVGHEDEIAIFIELHEGQQLTEDDVRALAEKEMPKYMQPTHIRMIDALPVTPTSKIEKYKLKQRILAELER